MQTESHRYMTNPVVGSGERPFGSTFGKKSGTAENFSVFVSIMFGDEGCFFYSLGCFFKFTEVQYIL